MFHNINIILKNKYNQKVNGESNSFSKGCFVSFSERFACSVGMRQSIHRESSQDRDPPISLRVIEVITLPFTHLTSLL